MRILLCPYNAASIRYRTARCVHQKVGLLHISCLPHSADSHTHNSSILHLNTSHSQTPKPANMTLIFVKGEKRTIESLCAMIDKAPKMDVFKLEDGTQGDIIVLSKALCEHPCLEEFQTTSVTLAESSLSLDEVLSMMLVSVPDLMHTKLEKVPISSSASAAPMRGDPCLEKFHMSSVLTVPSLSLDEVLSMMLDLIPELGDDELEKVPVPSSALAAAGSCAGLETPIAPKSGVADKDAIVFAEAVVQSPSIQFIDLSDLSDLGCIDFASALDKNSSIKTIHLEGSGKISGEQRTLIDTAFRRRSGGGTRAA
jgi:hypothetical protein